MAEKEEMFENVCHFEGDQVLKREFRISKLDDIYRRTETASKPANQGFFIRLVLRCVWFSLVLCDLDLIETKIKCDISSLTFNKQSFIDTQIEYKFPVPKHGLFQLPPPHWTSEHFSEYETNPMFINGYWARQETRYKILPNMYVQIITLIPECKWIVFDYAVKPYKVKIPFNIFSERLSYGILATNCSQVHLRIVVLVK